MNMRIDAVDPAHISIARSRLDAKLSRELGDAVLAALGDPAVVEIMLNPDGRLWEDRAGVGMAQIGEMTASRAENLIGTIANSLGQIATADNPIIEGELPLDGSRFEGVLPPIVERPIFAIRKKAIFVYSLSDYVRDGIMTQAQADTLLWHVRQKHNILVAGATGSGKTTLCNAILQCIAEEDPDTRIAIIEDTRELQCPVVNKFPMRTSEKKDMIQLLRATLRLRPDRIAVGEVRDGAALALLKSWNTGHSGGVATVHANSAQAALIRIEQLVQEAQVAAIPAVIAEAINCIVSIQKSDAGKRRVEQICTVNGARQNEYDLSFS